MHVLSDIIKTEFINENFVKKIMYTKINALKRKFVRKLFLFLRSVFYQRVFGRQVPFARKLTEVVRSWEKLQGMCDIPASGEVWESQYSGDQWKYMRQLTELARYSVIVGYLHFFKKGTILDVGCGEGILFRRYRPYGYSKYLGIDISQVAIDNLSNEQDEKTIFIRADVEKYTPIESFDVIVFNESIYYFNDPLEVVGRYIQTLKEDGILIISTYVKSERAISILNRIKATYFLSDEVQTTHESYSWICSVFVPLEKETISNLK